MVLSRKLVTAVITNILTVAAAYAVTKLGLHQTVGDAATVSGIIGQVASFAAGWVVKEVPSVTVG